MKMRLVITPVMAILVTIQIDHPIQLTWSPIKNRHSAVIRPITPHTTVILGPLRTTVLALPMAPKIENMSVPHHIVKVEVMIVLRDRTTQLKARILLLALEESSLNPHHQCDPVMHPYAPKRVEFPLRCTCQHQHNMEIAFVRQIPLLVPNCLVPHPHIAKMEAALLATNHSNHQFRVLAGITSYTIAKGFPSHGLPLNLSRAIRPMALPWRLLHLSHHRLPFHRQRRRVFLLTI